MNSKSYHHAGSKKSKCLTSHSHSLNPVQNGAVFKVGKHLIHPETDLTLIAFLDTLASLDFKLYVSDLLFSHIQSIKFYK